jgi:sulfite exporter TauE/SafE
MKAATYILVGLMITLMGLGGIEHSQTLVQLVQSVAVCVVGVCAMWVGTSWVVDDTATALTDLRSR